MERIDRGRGVAVLVDGNSLDLGLRTRRCFERALPAADVRLARGGADIADQVYGMLVHRPVLLLVVGGDRVSARVLDTLHRAEILLGSLDRPVVGLIAPVGNGWARSFGASDVEAVLRRLPGLDRDLPTRPCPLLETEGRVAPLAGADSGPLSVLRRLGTGCALAELELVDLSGGAEEIGPDARGPSSPGAVLYRGPFLGGGAATVPSFGVGLIPFPLAGRDRRRMHLRIIDRPVRPSVPQVFRGEMPTPWRDYLAGRVRLAFSRPVPVRLAGEDAGTLDEVEIGLAGEVPLVDWRAAFAA